MTRSVTHVPPLPPPHTLTQSLTRSLTHTHTLSASLCLSLPLTMQVLPAYKCAVRVTNISAWDQSCTFCVHCNQPYKRGEVMRQYLCARHCVHQRCLVQYLKKKGTSGMSLFSGTDSGAALSCTQCGNCE